MEPANNLPQLSNPIPSNLELIFPQWCKRSKLRDCELICCLLQSSPPLTLPTPSNSVAIIKPPASSSNRGVKYVLIVFAQELSSASLWIGSLDWTDGVELFWHTSLRCDAHLRALYGPRESNLIANHWGLTVWFKMLQLLCNLAW